MARVYSIGASHGAEEVVFHLRSISVAEENRFTARFASISDSESEETKALQEFEILVDSIASWSEKEPTIKKNGVVVDPEQQFESPAQAVKAYFEKPSNEKERTAQQVILQYRRKLQPNVVFY